jgi:hypothetical protein
MISYCEDNNQILYYGSNERFEISPPFTGVTPEQFQDLVGVHEIPQSFVCELNDIRLIGNRAIPRMTDGRFVLEEMGTEGMLRSRVLDTFQSLDTQAKIRYILIHKFSTFDDHVYDTIINLVPRHGDSHNEYVNYAHWLLEDLPRLRGYKEYYDNTGRNPQILLKKNPPSWMKETLQLLGFSASDWTEWTDQTATVSRLVVPKLNYVHSTGATIQPFDRKWVSKRMISNANSKTQQSERIFLSRQGQPRRKLSNFNEISRVLEEFDVEIIRPEELSIEDQIGVFKNAEVIVAPSGAALANMIFASDATVIDIKPYDIYDDMWYIVSEENELYYSFVNCEPTEGAITKDTEQMRLNPTDLKRLFEEIM